jgi:hypothetical protein
LSLLGLRPFGSGLAAFPAIGFFLRAGRVVTLSASLMRNSDTRADPVSKRGSIRPPCRLRAAMMPDVSRAPVTVADRR